MKRKVMFALFFFLALALYFPVFTTAEAEGCDAGDLDCKIDKGYSCLQEEIDARNCMSLGSDEKVFSFIATGRCKPEVISDSNYASSSHTSPDIKYTSLALLGGVSDGYAKDWLISKNRTTTSINWLLQIDTTSVTGEMTCGIKYPTSATANATAATKECRTR